MAIRCEDEFNPWPSFVDIFSSVILVMLLFLLVALVNLGFYAQFKYKVSYTGSISSDDIILNSNASKNIVKEEQEQKEKSESDSKSEAKEKEQVQEIVKLEQQVIQLKEMIEVKEAKEEKQKNIEAAGIDVKDRIDKEKQPKQQSVFDDDHFVITFKGNEIFIDDAITKKLKEFLKNAKSKYANHQVMITSADVKGQASATVAKQISLARSIGMRNLIRKLDYNRKDVRIDLLADTAVKEEINDQNGYLIIRIKK